MVNVSKRIEYIFFDKRENVINITYDGINFNKRIIWNSLKSDTLFSLKWNLKVSLFELLKIK